MKIKAEVSDVAGAFSTLCFVSRSGLDLICSGASPDTKKSLHSLLGLKVCILKVCVWWAHKFRMKNAKAYFFVSSDKNLSVILFCSTFVYRSTMLCEVSGSVMGQSGSHFPGLCLYLFILFILSPSAATTSRVLIQSASISVSLLSVISVTAGPWLIHREPLHE